MTHRLGLLLAAVLVAVPCVESAARVRAGCPNVTDPRGDLQFENPWSADLGWDQDSLDILSASVSSDGHNLITTVRVAALPAADEAHGYEWSVRLAPETSRRGEVLWLRAARITGGTEFAVQREYPTGGSSTGPTQSESYRVDSAPVSGALDVERGLISVRVPLSVLAAWDIRSHSDLFEIYAYSQMVSGVALPPPASARETWDRPSDETEHADLRSHVDDPGCRPGVSSPR